MPGLSLHEMKWSISIAQGRVFIHTAGLLDGHRMVWADETQRPEYHAFHARMKRLASLRRRIGF